MKEMNVLVLPQTLIYQSVEQLFKEKYNYLKPAFYYY